LKFAPFGRRESQMSFTDLLTHETVVHAEFGLLEPNMERTTVSPRNGGVKGTRLSPAPETSESAAR
jgi:hypothetical protein